MSIEGWEKGRVRAALSWPLPSVIHWLQTIEDRQALVDKSRGISVLMAHFLDYSSVDYLLIFEIVVAFVEVDKSLFV